MRKKRKLCEVIMNVGKMEFNENSEVLDCESNKLFEMLYDDDENKGRKRENVIK
jgi:hypothetical protein